MRDTRTCGTSLLHNVKKKKDILQIFKFERSKVYTKQTNGTAPSIKLR